MSKQWLTVAPEEARQNKLYGIGGWLIVFLVSLLLGVLTHIGQVSTMAASAGITLGQLFRTDHPFVTLLKVEFGIHFLMIAAIFYCLFTKHPKTRNIVTIALAANWPAAMLASAIIPHGMHGELGLAYFQGFVQWVMTCAIWISYFQRSERVRVTFEYSILSNATPNSPSYQASSPPNSTISNSENSAPRIPTHSHGDRSDTIKDIAPYNIHNKTEHTPMTQEGFDEDAIYETVANEVESGNTQKGLWTRLYVENDGDDNNTKLQYIKERANMLIAQEKLRIEQEAAVKAEQKRITEEKIKRFEAENNKLINAVTNGDWGDANSLLSQGMSPHLTNDKGLSLLEIAEKNGDNNIAALLRSFIATE